MTKLETTYIDLPDYITRAIKSGHVPRMRDWRAIAKKYPDELWRLTDGEQAAFFMETYLAIGEGDYVGKPVELLLFQEVFICSLFDGPMGRARKAYLSVGRKAGKTYISAMILICLMFMAFVRKDGSKEPLLKPMTRINSAALSREQSGLLWNYMSKTLAMSPKMADLYRSVPSTKKVINLKNGIEYQSLAFEAGRLMGLSPAALVGDEWGSIAAPSHPGIDALLTASGAHSNPLHLVISTQCENDSGWLSVQLDDCTMNPADDVVCHLYTADKELALDDPVAWEQACPAIGAFRSMEDVKQQAEVAKRLPTATASFENLILNRRVALDGAWLSPATWKENTLPFDMDVFRSQPVSLGLDLSMLNDLSAAVICAKDYEGNVHAKCYAFTPLDSAKERELRDKIPLTAWIRDGVLYAPPGKTLDYDLIAQYLRIEFEREGIFVDTIHFDAWRSQAFFAACDRMGFAQEAKREEVRQGFQSMSPRLEAMETALLQKRLRVGNQPVLNMGAAASKVKLDPAANKKITKETYHGPKVDGIVALVMAAYPLIVDTEPGFDVSSLIG